MTSVILPGFHPDPSIVRVGDDYFIATSTFEWQPGVRIHHSRDLADWRLAATPLDRPGLSDLRGVPDSCGVWAPSLSWSEGRFWLVYTIVRRFDGAFKDTHNFLTTSPTIEGPWSDPVFLNSSGFDPSLFHDADGCRWLLNMVWDHRPDRSPFGGIVLQEMDRETHQLTGPVHRIFEGTDIGLTEGPHLYRLNGWYYLITAEGGTGYGHAVTVARARSITGPYEPDPAGPLLTARDDPSAPLQRLGHGSLVETPQGELWMAHLCSRLLPRRRASPMGRETALTPLVFDGDWFRLDQTRQAPTAAPAPQDVTYRFQPGRLDPDFQWLRSATPDDLFSLEDRPGHLRLRGRESLGSLFDQALVARRQTAFVCDLSLEIAFEPQTFQQAAGLAVYYNGHKHHAVLITYDDTLGKRLMVMSCEADLSLAQVFRPGPALPPGPIELRAEIRLDRLTLW